MNIRTAWASVALAAQLWPGPAPLEAAGQAGPVDPPVSAATAGPRPDITPDITPHDYVIGPEDVLSVVFWGDAQLSGEVLVRPDGKISVPLLDDVQAAGLTPQQLRDRLMEKASRFVAGPVATVVVKAINSRKVYITGQVARPGQYPLTTSLTVIQLIATAGGLGDYAKPRDIRIVRMKDGQLISIPFDYEQTIRGVTVPRQVQLQPGDTVMVP